MNKPNVNKYFKMVTKSVKKRSPEILTGLGIAGMITTTVLAVKGTPKALELIEEAEKEKALKLNKKSPESDNGAASSKLTPQEIIKTAWKPYVPALSLGAASVACLIGANSAHARRHAALYSAYKLSETALTEYKDKVREIVPEKKVKEIKQKLAEDKVDKVTKDNPETKTNVIVSSDGDTWFIDAMSNMPFKSTKNKLDAAANKLNKDMISDMCVSLSDFYDEIGLPHTGVSDSIGWTIDKDSIEVDVSEAVVRDGTAYVVMDFLARPVYGYDRLY